MFLPSSSVERTISRHDLLTAHFLLRRILHVTDVDKGKETAQMPLLTLEGDLIRDHPVIDELGCDKLTARLSISTFRENGRSHRRIDVSRYLSEKLWRKWNKELNLPHASA